MKSSIEINRLQIYAFHGVMPQETRVGNLFEVTVKLDYDFAAASATDNINLALNYAMAVETIQQVMATPRKLIETVATDIKAALIEQWPGITSGIVRVAKLHPPFTPRVESVAVSIEW